MSQDPEMEILEACGEAADFSVFERAVERMDGIEAIPAVAHRLLTLTADPDASMAEIEQLIVSDPALTARVLRVAASALYGGTAVPTLHAAVVRLGLNEIRNLALTASLTRQPADPFHKDLWHHCLAVAVLAEDLAKRLGSRRFLEPFICGLLHEVGMLVLSKLLGGRYPQLVGDEGPLAQLERETASLGFTHCDLGALAAERWNLFEGLQQVFQFHHEPLAAANLDFPAPVLETIYLVSLAADVVRDPEQNLDALPTRDLLERLGADPDLLSEAVHTALPKAYEYLSAVG